MCFILWYGSCSFKHAQVSYNHVKDITRKICPAVLHYDDVIMDSIASQITSLTIVYSTVHSGADQSKHQSSASLAFVWEIHRWPVNFPHKWPVTRKMFPFDDVIMDHNNPLLILHTFLWEPALRDIFSKLSKINAIFSLKILCFHLFDIKLSPVLQVWFRTKTIMYISVLTKPLYVYPNQATGIRPKWLYSRQEKHICWCAEFREKLGYQSYFR